MRLLFTAPRTHAPYADNWRTVARITVTRLRMEAARSPQYTPSVGVGIGIGFGRHLIAGTAEPDTRSP